MSSSGSYLKFEVQGSISTLGSQAKNKRSHPRCRRTLTLRASYTFFAFLLVLLYFQLWPSSLINLAVSIPTIDTAQNFRPQNDRDVPTKRASTLPNSEEATLHAPAAASPHEGTSVLNSPARASTLQETGKTVSLLRVESSVVEGHPATATSVESHVTTSTDLSTQSERSTMNVSVEPLKTGSTATLPQKDMLIADKSIALQNAKPDDTSSGRDPAIIDAPSLSQQSMINNASAQGMATTTTNNISLREESSVRNATVLLREAETATTPKQEAMHVAHDPVAPTDARVTVTPVRQDSAMIKPVRQDSAAIVLDASAFPTTKKEAVLLIPAVNYTGGAIDVIELARKHVEPASNITAAICYKTLFGDIDIGLVLQWVAYNHLLGFDHVFMFYRPEMKNVSRIDVLRALPFVTLSEWTGGTLENYYDQRATERLCLSDQKFARSYDWAMIADIDEYLWLPEVYDGVKAFLQQEAQNMTYLSFGKYMYTLDHRTDTAANNYKLDAMAKDSPFVFSQYPFYMNYFCYGIRIGEAICPTWRGRAKVIVKPANHQWIDVHGIYPHPINITGAVHYHPELGHFKEWPHIFDDHNITKRQPQCFTVEEEEDVHIHNMKRAFNTYKNGTYLVKYDDRLQQWFHRVINRARVPVISVS